MDDHEATLNRAVQSLKAQGIAVESGITVDGKPAHAVMSHFLTAEQIVGLFEKGALTKEGIEAFAASVERD